METKNKVPYSMLSQMGRKQLRDLIPLQIPLTLYLDPSSYCNFKCSCCARNNDDYRQFAGNDSFFDMGLYNRLIKELKGWGKLKSLKMYFIGEPLMNPNLTEMLEMALNAEIAERVEITSNGSLLTSAISEKLIDICRDCQTAVYLRISIYSIHQERHLDITQSNVTVQEIYDKIKQFREIRDGKNANNPFLYVKMIDTCSEENQEFLNIYGKLADEAVIEEPMNWNGYEQRPLLDMLYEGCKKPEITKNFRSACPYPFYSLAVTADADVVCCCVDWNKMTIVGNLKDHSLQEIWEGNRLRNFQKQHLMGMKSLNAGCKNCEVLYRCPKSDDVDGVPVNQLGFLRDF